MLVPPAWLWDLLSALLPDLGQGARSLWATTLFCNTEGISLLLPTREGPLGSMSGQTGVTAGQTDSSTLTLEGMCPEPAGEDMPDALPAQGTWKRSL